MTLFAYCLGRWRIARLQRRMPHAARQRMRDDQRVERLMARAAYDSKAMVLLLKAWQEEFWRFPCAHGHVFRRDNGDLLCTSCWQVRRIATNFWAQDSPIFRCGEGRHISYPPEASMPGMRQCMRCPAVWQDEMEGAR